jgi:hypothetical protein
MVTGHYCYEQIGEIPIFDSIELSDAFVHASAGSDQIA